MSQEELERSMNKMVSVIKPKEVLEIDFDLVAIDKNEYYMSVEYVVSDDSPYLKMSTSPRMLENIKSEWNSLLNKNIKNFFNVKITINPSDIRSESWYKQHNQ